MVETVGILRIVGSIVSPVIRKLVEKASPYFGGDVTGDKLKNLATNVLPQIQIVIDAAEIIPSVKLELWITELKAAAFEAEDVLDEYEYKCLQQQVTPLPSLLGPVGKCFEKTKESFAPVSLKTKLMKSLDKVEKIASGVRDFIEMLRLNNDIKNNPNFAGVSRTMPIVRHTTVPSPPQIVVGRDQERNRLIDLLIDEEPENRNRNQRVSIHAICCIAGGGKTTLAQCVFNDPRVVEHFGDMRIWVHVSRNFDVLHVTKQIIEFATKSACPVMESLGALQAKMKEIFRNSENKVLLVLDDLWSVEPENRIQFDTLLIPLNEVGYIGSKVLMTTRMEKVASILGATSITSLNDLDAADCRSIVEHYAFANLEGVTVTEDLANIMDQIISKLKSSPLAARMVGIQLGCRVSVDAWSMILKGDLIESPKSALLWSFKCLPQHLQRCFAFCSLYEKGSFFDDDRSTELLRFWIAEGFVEAPKENDLSLEDKARQYFNDLVSYSFFQADPYWPDTYVMHDLLHDLAEDISKDHFFRIEDDTPVNTIPETVIHLSITNVNPQKHMSNILKLVNLRTFIMFPFWDIDLSTFIDLKKMCKKLTKLRVLHFGYYTVPKLDSSVGWLKHLRYLQLRKVNKLPESLSRLYHLQFLVLFSESIDRVPKCFSNLINLRLFLGNYDLYKKIPEIGKLTSLQTLERYSAIRRRQYGIGQLKNLLELRGSLTILDLENINDAEEASGAMLKNKSRLEGLELHWGYSIEGNSSKAIELLHRSYEKVLEGLEPHPNLRELEIDGYKGAKLPRWMLNDQCIISNLQSLTLSNCPILKSVPFLPHRLKTLHIWRCRDLMELLSLPHNLMELKVEDCSNLMQLSPFPRSLEYLHLQGDFPGIETFFSSISSSSYDDENRGSHRPFLLKVLNISGCSNLHEKTLNACLQKFVSLFQLNLWRLPTIASLVLGPNLAALHSIDIDKCDGLISIGVSGSFPFLQTLHIDECHGLRMMMSVDGEVGHATMPSSLSSIFLQGLTSLSELNFRGFPSSPLLTLPSLTSLTALEKLEIRCFPELTSMGNLQPLASLKDLTVLGCPRLTTALKGGDKTAKRLLSIKGKLKINEALLLTVLLQEQGLSSLQELEIYQCSQDRPFNPFEEDFFQQLTSVKSLCFYGCPNLPSLPMNLEKLSSFKDLLIKYCKKLDSLPNLPASLEYLHIEGCPQLQMNYGDGGPLFHKISHIPHFKFVS